MSVIVLVAMIVSTMNRVRTNVYTLDTTVIETNQTNNVVACEDSTGNIWEYESRVVCSVGAERVLVMDNKGTTTIYDDEIIITINK